MILGVLFLSGCVDQIDFERGDTEVLLVVEGRKTMGKSPTAIRLRWSAPYGIDDNEPVSFAQISMFNEQGDAEYFEEDPLKPGTYISSGEMITGIPGQAYFIEIKLESGQTYRSVPDTMPYFLPLHQVYFDLTEYEFFNEYGFPVKKDRIRVFVNSSFPTIKNGPYFRWEVKDVWSFNEVLKPWDPLFYPKTCYIEEVTSPQYIPLFNGDIQETNQIEGQMVGFRDINYSFLEKHYFNVYQIALSAEGYAYWERLNRVTNKVGNIFDAPPATVRGNMYNVDNPNEIVLGFFETAAIDTARFFTLPQDFSGIPIYDICEPDYRFTPPRFNDVCDNCLQIRNSTLKRPDYF